MKTSGMVTCLVVVVQGCFPGLKVQGNARHRLGIPRRGKYMVSREDDRASAW